MDYNSPDIAALTPEQRKTSTLVGIADKEQGLYGQSFWLPFKQLVRATDVGAYGGNVRLNNGIIMRYAEVLLLYAEACLQSGDAAQAKWAVNEIQKRAGSKTVSDNVDMNVLKKEKNYELWLEGSRWLDLVRWGDTDRVKQAGQDVPKLFDKLYREPKSTDQGIKWLDNDNTQRFYTVSTHEAIDAKYEVGFKAGKHEFFPYPTSEMDRNPNMVQNPGWE